MAIFESILNLVPGRNHLAEIAQGRNQPNSVKNIPILALRCLCLDFLQDIHQCPDIWGAFEYTKMD